MNRLIFLAWSEEMPAWMARRWRAVPFEASSTLPTSNDLSDTSRLTSFSWSTW